MGREKQYTIPCPPKALFGQTPQTGARLEWNSSGVDTSCSPGPRPSGGLRDRESNGGRPRSTVSSSSWLAAHYEDLSISCIGHQPCLWPMALSPLPADKPKEILGTWGEDPVGAGSIVAVVARCLVCTPN